MTPEQRLEAALDELSTLEWQSETMEVSLEIHQKKKEIISMLAEERAACAKVADDEGADLTGAAKETASSIADAIRARGQQ